MLAVRQMTI